MLERAIAIATEAHKGQQDKADQPYILHILRVMLCFNADPERIVAVLHDLLEDTDWIAADLIKEGFSLEIVEAVEALTKMGDESYDDFIHRVVQNPVARKVKIADLEDNMSPLRILNPTEGDCKRCLKYKYAYQVLTHE